MLASIRTSVLALVRDKSLLVWTLAFPLIMTCIFMAMFSGFDDAYSLVGSRLGIVRNAQYESVKGLDDMLTSLARAPKKSRICTLAYYACEKDARAAAADGAIDSYLTVGSDGTPALHVSQASIAANSSRPATVLSVAINSYVRTSDAIASASKKSPELSARGAVQDAYLGNSVQIKHFSATKNAPDSYASFYFALLAMTAGMGAMSAALTTKKLLPTASAVGARQALSSTPRWRMLVGALLGAWICQFACMLAALLFMATVAHVDFGSGAAPLVLAVAVSSLASCAMGSLLGTIPHMQAGMVSGITCLLSLFTGLYGPSAQEITYALETSAPVLAHANPLWQISHCFYSLLYYDTYNSFARCCLTLLLMTLVALALAGIRMRKVSHAHL